jgi:hypothetical protein
MRSVGAAAESLPDVDSLVDWIKWIPTVPSKNAVARRLGLRGHQSTWKAQLSADGSWGVLEVILGANRDHTHLLDDFGRLWIPTQRAIVLPTR